MMWKGPGIGEDAKNLALIGAAALVGVAGTAFMLDDRPEHRHVRVVRTEVVRPHIAAPAAPVLRFEMSEALTGSNRLYGTVRTQDGDSYTGFLRWDRNEGSWADLLDATKFEEGQARSQSGIRFGNVAQIQAVGREMAIFTLRSGRQVGMASRSSDLGSQLRSLTVSGPNGEVELEWRDLRTVDFEAAPSSAQPYESRLHGTLTTRSGLQFTGYITWDVDEVYTTDQLDGDYRGEDYEIPFGAIHEIERRSSQAATVKLNSGQEIVLSGSNDVNRQNRGISVSDPLLGEIKVDWRNFDNVTFHPPAEEVSLDAFPSETDLRGTVVTRSGETFGGRIQWDRDEASTWEMLNGRIGDAEAQIEFSRIAEIEKAPPGVRVRLKDGRTFDLYGSNDVDRDNRGVVIEAGSDRQVISWRDFETLRLER
ncbi:MAG: hypothetical protein HKN73_02050 [Gemmatimonadetes bacterium]|nr:hypothetical protein [Gemmatimonadota bacterium]